MRFGEITGTRPAYGMHLMQKWKDSDIHVADIDFSLGKRREYQMVTTDSTKQTFKPGLTCLYLTTSTAVTTLTF